MSGFDILGALDRLPEPRLVGGTPNTELSVGGGDTGVAASESSFASTLDGALGRLRNLQLDTNQKFEALGRGEHVELHDVMMAMGKSEVAFNLMIEVRNKLVEAWQRLSTSVS